eukprot:1150997-Pelagomonas_calceolata.AAC.3
MQGGEEEHMGRKPMIAFPLRVAPNGERISSLPASEPACTCVGWTASGTVPVQGNQRVHKQNFPKSADVVVAMEQMM